MIHNWSTFAQGSGIVVNTTPTQLFAAIQIPSPGGGQRASMKARFEFYNDDPTNMATVTLNKSGDSTRPDVAPITLIVNPLSFYPYELTDTADLFFWASAVASAGTCSMRYIFLLREF